MENKEKKRCQRIRRRRICWKINLFNINNDSGISDCVEDFLYVSNDKRERVGAKPL